MRTICLALGVCLSVPVYGAVQTEAIEYSEGDTVLSGYLAYDDATKDKRPGVLVAHAWMGLGEHEKDSAQKLAEMGYVALAVDVYGKDVHIASRDEAMTKSGEFRGNRALLRSRMRAGLETLRAHALVDPDRIGAIGYCFGGMAVLELARSGESIRGVVTFHGALNSPAPEDAKNITCKVLVLHGADDPAVPQEEVLAFQKEMRDAKVDWQMIEYGGAVHSFSDPAANFPPVSLYHEPSARRSWQAMAAFFEETLE